MGLLTPSININDIIIDKCKVDRAKTKVKTTAQEKHDQSMENLICIVVDGRMDKNILLYKEICGGKWTENYEKKTKGPECHLTSTKETPCRSKYLTHKILPNIGATGAVHAKQVVDVLHEFNCENTIKAILVDNTNANTGCEGGMVAIFEKSFFLNLHTIGSSLHHNNFRDLFKNIHGCTKGPTAFSGPPGEIMLKGLP